MIRTICCVLLFTLLYLNTTLGQKNSSYTFEANGINLAQAIDHLSRSYDLRFSFASDLIDTENLVFFDIAEHNIDDLLTEVLNAYAVEYKLTTQNNVLLRKKDSATKSISQSEIINIDGKIIDANYGTSIDHAAISIEKENFVVFSDTLGNFSIDIPSEWIDYTLSVHMLGYEVSEILVTDLINKEEKNIKILSKPIFIDHITILDRPNSLKIEGDKVLVRSSRYNSLSGGLATEDILRRMQLLPGIDASDDTSSEIKIRGSNSDETLIILDGIPLYNSSHYYGIFSAINTDYIKNVNIYKNSQPINLGYKTSGVVELLSDQHIPQTTTGQIDFNLLESSILLDVPINANSKISLSGRKSITNISNTSFNSIGTKQDINLELDRKTTLITDPNFGFWDINAKVQAALTEQSSFSINYYSSVDKYDNTTSRPLRIADNSTRTIDIITEQEQWKTQGASLTWDYLIKEDLSIKLNGYTTSHQSNSESQVTEELLELSTNDDELEQLNESDGNNISEKSVNLYLEKSMNHVDITMGSKYTDYSNDIDIKQLSQRLFAEQSNASSITNYAQLAYKKQHITLTIGLRNIYYTPTKLFHWSPQLYLAYNLNDGIKLKASYSKQYQFQKELSFESGFNRNKQFWILANDNNAPESSSNNYMLGLNYANDRFILDLEFYHKATANVLEFSPIFLPPRPGDDRPVKNFRLLRGDAITYGADFILSKSWKHLTTQVSYSYLKSQNRFPQINMGEYYPSKNDIRHQLKFMGIYNYKDFSFSSNWIYASGRPYIDREKLLSKGSMGRDRLNIMEIQSKLTSYLRMDLSAAYHFNIDMLKTSLGASIFNVLDRKNVKYQQQLFGVTKETGKRLLALGTNSSLLSRTFNINIVVHF